MDLTETRLASTPVFDGNLLHIRSDTVRLPNGKTATREWMHHRGACVIVAFDAAGRLLLVRQYRYPIGQTILELPAGKIDEGETPLECAARELEEETGCIAGRLTHFATMTPSPAYTDEMLYLFFAEDLTERGQHLDADEFLTVERMPLDEALALLDGDGLIDAKTQIGLLRWLRHRETA